jgi:hypothetical protein
MQDKMASRTRTLAVILALNLLIAVACASAGASAQATATPAALPTATADAPASSGLIVTLDMNGQTVTMRNGERFLLQLGEEYNWTVIPDDPRVISRVVNVMTIRGSQGLYEAHVQGNTTLRASGDPQCRSSQPPCTAPSRMFVINVVVQ